MDTKPQKIVENEGECHLKTNFPSRLNKENATAYNLLKYIYGLGYGDNQTRGIKLEKDVTAAQYVQHRMIFSYNT